MFEAEGSTAGPYPAASQRFRWRRLFQFSLSSLLILTTVCAALMAWWSYKAQEQRTALAGLGGKRLHFQYDFEKNDPYASGPPIWPGWLVDAIGEDYFSNVIGVYVNEKSTEPELELLQSLPSLKWLRLRDVPANDSTLKNLRCMSSLELLDLSGTHVDDAGLHYLEDLTKLKELDLTRTRITDAGVARLQKALPNCKISH